MQQHQQEPAEGCAVVAALVGVAVDHADGQRTQQIGAADGRQPGKGNARRDQHLLQKIVEHERHGIRRQQPHVALDAAVSPHLAVNLSRKPGGKDTDAGHAHMIHHAGIGDRLAGKLQQEQLHCQYDHHIVGKQRPLDVTMSLQHSHPHIDGFHFPAQAADPAVRRFPLAQNPPIT